MTSGDVLAVDQDLAAVHVHEAQQQLRQRRLPRPGRPHQGHVLAGLHGEGQVVEQRVAGPVAEADPAELHLAARHPEASGLRARR